MWNKKKAWIKYLREEVIQLSLSCAGRYIWYLLELTLIDDQQGNSYPEGRGHWR